MLVKNKTWNAHLLEEFEKDYFKNLWQQIDNEYQNNICFPPKDQIFNAFEQFDFENIKVVILGQDPYHGIGEAHGLSFSVPDGVKIPPSLKNIFTEINLEYESVFFPTTGNLEHWANQGVLLLNATLSVQKDKANSHKNLNWQMFTDEVIRIINLQTNNTVFLLWGGFAHKKTKLIDPEKHLILKSGHPSPLSANRGFWFGNNHFIQTNTYLEKHGKSPIKWI